MGKCDVWELNASISTHCGKYGAGTKSAETESIGKRKRGSMGKRRKKTFFIPSYKTSDSLSCADRFSAAILWIWIRRHFLAKKGEDTLFTQAAQWCSVG